MREGGGREGGGRGGGGGEERGGGEEKRGGKERGREGEGGGREGEEEERRSGLCAQILSLLPRSKPGLSDITQSQSWGVCVVECV